MCLPWDCRKEHSRRWVVGNCRRQLAEAVAHIGCHKIDTQYHRHDKTETLDSICPYQRFHTSLSCIEPYQRNCHNHVELKRYMKRCEYQELQHSAYHKEAHCRAEHLGDEEKPCPGAIGRCAEALFKIAVDRYELCACRTAAPAQRLWQSSLQ